MPGFAIVLQLFSQALPFADLDQESPKDQARHEADLKTDREQGAKYVVEVEKEYKLSENAAMIARVQRVGGKLAAIAKVLKVKASWGDKRLNPFDYTFKVVKGEDVNAFSLPGGYIYVNEGLVNYVESDDELAGILAHEIAHASMRHVATLRREAGKLQAITLPLILAAIFSKSDAAIGLGTIGNLTGVAIGSGWSQKAESAADYGGLQYMLSSDYKPLGILTVMERLAYDERTKPAIMWGIFQTHPPTRQRARELTAQLKASDVSFDRSAVSTSLRTLVKPAEKGRLELWYAGIRLASLGGDDALSRAEAAAKRLNQFFDSGPKLFDVQADGASVRSVSQVFLTFAPDDKESARQTPEQQAALASQAVKRAIYERSYRLWDAN